MRKRGREARAKWRRIVAEQKRSGQSVAAFCRERGLCAPQFFAWKKRLGEAAAEKFVAVHVVEAGAPSSSRAIEVRLCGGRSIMVEPGFEAAHLRAVLAALETRA
jgi:transposase-like protein